MCAFVWVSLLKAITVFVLGLSGFVSGATAKCSAPCWLGEGVGRSEAWIVSSSPLSYLLASHLSIFCSMFILIVVGPPPSPMSQPDDLIHNMPEILMILGAPAAVAEVAEAAASSLVSGKGSYGWD